MRCNGFAKRATCARERRACILLQLDGGARE